MQIADHQAYSTQYASERGQQRALPPHLAQQLALRHRPGDHVGGGDAGAGDGGHADARPARVAAAE